MFKTKHVPTTSTFDSEKAEYLEWMESELTTLSARLADLPSDSPELGDLSMKVQELKLKMGLDFLYPYVNDFTQGDDHAA